MPLEPYKRGRFWWVRGTDDSGAYHRGSLRTTDEAVANAKVREIERKARKRALLGPDAPDERDELTFAQAVALYPANDAHDEYLLKVLPILGGERCNKITGQRIKDVARQLYPDASTDTWHRQVIVPVRAVINHAAELGKAHPIRVKSFTRNERMAQDRARRKASRQKKTPADWEWVMAFRQEALHPTTKQGRRRRRPNPYLAALAPFMFTTAARVTQALEILPGEDLDLQNARVRIPAAKGHEAQWIEITMMTVVDLANLKPRHGRVFGYKRRNDLYGPWRTICKAAGIEVIMPHAAGRHGFFTDVLVRQREDVASAMEAGRAASARLVIETYTHADGAKKRIRDRFNEGPPRTSGVQAQNRKASK